MSLRLITGNIRLQGRTFYSLSRVCGSSVSGVGQTPVPVSDKPIGLPAAPNRQQKWSKSQAQRMDAMTGPRFEQTDMNAQPQPVAAIELINAQPVIKVGGRTACCDGGGGAAGHPKVFINLDRPGPQSCGYCGLRFEQEAHH